MLLLSVVASIVLTVALNIAVRLFPGGARRAQDGLERLAARSSRAPGDGARVVVPWKAMLLASLVLTVALNLLLFVVK